MGPLIEFEQVDVVFGGKAAKVRQLLQEGKSRQEILKLTGQVVAVKSLSLKIFKEEIFVLMGLSGSGKSSLLRTVNGLNVPCSGKIWLEHEGSRVDLVTCPPAVMREIRMKRVAMVFQQFGLMPWRTVEENVAYGLELQQVPVTEMRDRVQGCLELVQLGDWARKFPHQLSGGMQQRVGLARALATEADILLMDEPFSALDPMIRHELQDELISLQKKLHKTIIFVCHDLDEAIRLGQRIGIMKEGQLLKSGTVEEVINPSGLASVVVDHYPVSLKDRKGNWMGIFGCNKVFRDLIEVDLPAPGPSNP